ncbi:uncharacterized protein LOC125655132 [Ostrea edulis]|uniref:uncharacterized protein LOC125655132 n=1 Tax=Ostrea edulis TaxID=37623 RepID=UPI0024AF73AB|nr:uncharacterized protein LOC125655132 [Ostrea edulis]
MNLCHFAKVIIARSTKNISEIKYHENFVNGNHDNNRQKSPKYDSSISGNGRYLFYTEVMHSYPKMSISRTEFCHKLSRIQTYLSQNKYYKNANKSGEKMSFLEAYNLTSWLDLSEKERRSHKLHDCSECKERESTLHVSASKETKCLENLSETITNSISAITSPKTANKTVQRFIAMLSPMLKQKLDVDFKECVEKTFNFQGKETPAKKQKRATKTLEKNNKNMRNIAFSENENMHTEKDDVQISLDCGISCSHERESPNKYYIKTPKSVKKSQKTKLGLDKSKKYCGKFENYTFNKNALLLEIGEAGCRNVNCAGLGKRYTIRNKALKFPDSYHGYSAGEILQNSPACSYHGYRNVNKLVSGKDIAQRVLRKYLRATRGRAVPRQRAIKQTGHSQRRNLECVYVSSGVAPKDFEKTAISNTGDLICEKEEIFDQKYALPRIWGHSWGKPESLELLGSESDEVCKEAVVIELQEHD